MSLLIQGGEPNNAKLYKDQYLQNLHRKSTRFTIIVLGTRYLIMI